MSTTLSTPAPAAPRRFRLLRPSVLAAQFIILVVLFGSWELGVRSGYVNGFLFGSPAGVVDAAWKLIQSGELWEHAGYTLWASALGFELTPESWTLIQPSGFLHGEVQGAVQAKGGAGVSEGY